MYGLVNQAIHGLIIDNYGAETWTNVKAKANVDKEFFLSSEQYDDNITFDLAIAASQVLNVPLSNVLIEFGKYWVLKTARHGYGGLMDSGGDNFEEFIFNLPNFHSRVMLLYSEIKPPEFVVEKTQQGSILIHYYSTRIGLTYFMLGLIYGLAEYYTTKINVNIVSEKSDIHNCDTFEISIEC